MGILNGKNAIIYGGGGSIGGAVDAHADEVAGAAGSIDVSMNVIGHPYTHGTPVHEMDVDDYVAPVDFVARTTFITARAAARHMVRQGSGVILSFGGTGYPMRDYAIGGTQVAFDAVESMRRQFSAELGPHGVRWITLITNGVPTSVGDFEGAGDIAAQMAAVTMTGRAATLDDVGNTAAYAASDWARSLTAATINISAGTIVDF